MIKTEFMNKEIPNIPYSLSNTFKREKTLKGYSGYSNKRGQKTELQEAFRQKFLTSGMSLPD